MTISQQKLIQKDVLKPLLHEANVLVCVLDACRFDVFQEVCCLPGQLEKAISAGSTTTEWAQNTFDETYPVIYASSVPWIAAKMTKYNSGFNAREHFELINDIWDWGFDLEVETVFPEVVVEAVSQMRERYPDKSMIAHFIQPHCPYIGEPSLTMKEWNELAEVELDHFPALEMVIRKFPERFFEAYRGNLARVLNCIEKFSGSFNKIILTADHGEGFGEQGVYGHGPDIRIPELIEVPWFTFKQ